MRSAALIEAAAVLDAVADGVRGDAAAVAGAVRAAGPPAGPDRSWIAAGAGGWLLGDLSDLSDLSNLSDLSDLGGWVAWVRLEGRVLGLAGPAGLWGEAFRLEAVALRLRAAARVYEEVEQGVAAVFRGVAQGVDAAGRGGWFADGVAPPVVTRVRPRWASGRIEEVADLVAAGEGLGGGRVRVVETEAPGGGSAWVVVVPGTQEWSPEGGLNPFDLTTDVRAVTGDATVAAAGVVRALDLARARSPGSRPDDPVLLVGHSQGGILAAALASDPAFRAGHRVTHVVTSGSPVGVFAVPPSVRVLSLQHADDPVHRLDLGPNPARSSWVTVEAPVVRPDHPLDVRRHGLDAYLATLHTVEGAPRGTVPGFDGWRATAGDFVGVPVRSVTEVVVERPL